jgi:hypothetical protein
VDIIVHGEFIHVIVNDRILLGVDPSRVTVNGTGANIDSYSYAGETFQPADVLH